MKKMWLLLFLITLPAFAETQYFTDDEGQNILLTKEKIQSIQEYPCNFSTDCMIKVQEDKMYTFYFDNNTNLHRAFYDMNMWWRR